MIAAIGKWWRCRQRSIDLQILWPSCCELAPTLDHAKAAFAVHAFNDNAWTDDYDHDALKAYIDAMECTVKGADDARDGV